MAYSSNTLPPRVLIVGDDTIQTGMLKVRCDLHTIGIPLFPDFSLDL